AASRACHPRLAPTPPPASAMPASSTSYAAPATASPTCAPCSPTCGAPAPARTCWAGWTGVPRRWTSAPARCSPLGHTSSRSASAYCSLARKITAALTPADLLTSGGSGCAGQALGQLPGTACQVRWLQHLEVVPEQGDVQQHEVQ